jgi:hypothetical protein
MGFESVRQDAGQAKEGKMAVRLALDVLVFLPTAVSI